MARAAAILAVLLAAVAAAGAADQQKAKMFILAGQSNMVGKGATAELPADLKKTPANVKLYHAGRAEPLAAAASFGPEVAFAHELAKAWPERQIIIVKFAVGGTSLLDWAPDWTEQNARRTETAKAGPLYSKLLEYVKAAAAGRPVEIAAVVWEQGGRDAKFPDVAGEYGKNLRTLVERLRKDLAAPDLPFIYGEVNTPPARFPATEDVRKGQQQVAREVPRVKLVPTKGLRTLSDETHYDTQGQLELGKRFARAFLELGG